MGKFLSTYSYRHIWFSQRDKIIQRPRICPFARKVGSLQRPGRKKNIRDNLLIRKGELLILKLNSQ